MNKNERIKMAGIERLTSYDQFKDENPELGFRDYGERLAAYRKSIAVVIAVSVEDLHSMGIQEIQQRLSEVEAA